MPSPYAYRRISLSGRLYAACFLRLHRKRQSLSACNSDVSSREASFTTEACPVCFQRRDLNRGAVPQLTASFDSGRRILHPNESPVIPLQWYLQETLWPCCHAPQITHHCLFRLPFLSLWFSLCLIQLSTKGAVLIIYTESDYLEAHLTEISQDSHNWSDAVPHLIADALKKFVHSDANDNSSPKSRPSKPRTR